LALFLLGPPHLERDGITVDIARRKAMALLAYLAVTGETHSRQTLANLLWPEYDERRARADLRRTLSVLNRTLGNEWFSIKRDTVSLNWQSNFWLDVAQFHKLLAQCKAHSHLPQEVCPACLPVLTEAVALYRDDFLAGFTLPDSANFDDWQFFQSEQLHLELAQALERLVYCYTGRSEFETALTYAQRWVGLDPLHEAAHRFLMQLYAQTGQRAAALRQYQVCLETLKAELDILPSTETTNLYEQIRTDKSINNYQLVINNYYSPAVTSQSPREASNLQLPVYHYQSSNLPIHNLPVQPTPFIGRRSELAEIAGRLADPACQLLTLIGPGGIGKTRLALEAAAGALANNTFPDGVYFIPLAPSSRADFLVSAIGHALRLAFYGPESFEENPTGQLLSYLRDRKILLVIDNFEYLISAVDLLVEMLQTAPNLTILVTSRERLNLQAEWVLEIPGMRVPEEDEIERLEEYSAVRLFLQNARRTQADFELTEEDKPYVIRICRLVGGMPLGIQLASAWVRFLSCREIAQEIEQNLDFLATSLRDIPERHRSLGVVFAQGWNLLSDEERRAYRQLSVFQGGFRRIAAAEVVNASLPLLSALADKSFLHRTPAGRYEMHEVLRQYAAEKLHEDPVEEEQTRARHAAFYAAFLQHRYNNLKGRSQKKTMIELGEEIENIRVSWHWAVTHREINLIDLSLETLYRFYEIRGWVSEGEAAFGRAVAALAIPKNGDSTAVQQQTFVLGKLMARQGALCSRLGLPNRAYDLLQKSLTIFRRLEEPEQIAFALNYLGAVARLRGEYEQCKAFWHESLSIYREIGDRWGVAWSLNFLGHLAGEQGEYLEARQFLQESLAIHQEMGNQRGMAGSLNSLGYTVYLLGEYEEARSLLQEALAIRREVGYRRGIAISLNYLGQVAGALGELPESKRYFYEALKIAMNIEDIPLTLDILVGLATSVAKEGQTQQALELLHFPLYHVASGQEAKVRAQLLREALESHLSSTVAETAHTILASDTQQLEAAVASLLADQSA
jgi:predicted ATPase/DNA-binding SARP family transcriptional activator